jgi:tetratricopeptide (TPR) repeat protein
MELLKLFVSIILIGFFSSNLKAQSSLEDNVKAFQSSYINEASGDYASAIEDLKKIYSENFYEVNLRLGYLCYMKGRFTESSAYYNNAISLLPYGIEARFGYVLPLAAIGNYTAVLKQYEKILEISPNNSIALHRMGLIYYGREDYSNAEKYFDKVINLFPFDYEGLTMLAWTKLKLGKTREAKTLFYKALLNTPSGSSAEEGLELLSENQ